MPPHPPQKSSPLAASRGATPISVPSPFPFPSSKHSPIRSVPNAKRHRREFDKPLLLQDRLGKLLARTMYYFASSKSWHSYVRKARGKSHLSPDVAHLPHKAAHYLDQLRRHGAEVLFKTKPWTSKQLEECVHRGSHSSAQDHVDFVRDEMADFIEQGYWTVLPFRFVKNLPNL